MGMKPIEIACRHADKDGPNCSAPAGEKCRWPQPWAERMGFHAERIDEMRNRRRIRKALRKLRRAQATKAMVS
jgi:hypothetical protein